MRELGESIGKDILSREQINQLKYSFETNLLFAALLAGKLTNDQYFQQMDGINKKYLSTKRSQLCPSP